MKRHLVLSILLVLLISCDDDDNVHTNIPSVVLNSFLREYPQALDVGWEQRDSLYQVDFELAGEDLSALIDAEGQITGRKREIKLKDIPSQVLSGLHRNFGSSELDGSALVEIYGETFYQLEVEKFLFDEKIILDVTGKINNNFPYWE